MSEEVPQEETKENEESKLEQSLKECQDKYLRLLAETENARKRMHKEREELTKYALENVLVEFLYPLDNFEKALKFAEGMSEDVKKWAIGFEMLLGQFRQVLLNHGVVEFESEGKHFDPHHHEAVEVDETSSYPPGMVIKEFVRGYRMGERTIRPARVKVSKAPSSEKSENNNEGV